MAGWSAREIIAEFRHSGAISHPSAQRFHARTSLQERTFAWLLELEIIRQPTPGRYYLDEEALAARNATRIFE